MIRASEFSWVNSGRFVHRLYKQTAPGSFFAVPYPKNAGISYRVFLRNLLSSRFRTGDINHILPAKADTESIHSLEHLVLKGLRIPRVVLRVGVSVVRTQTIYEFRPAAPRPTAAPSRSGFERGVVVSICESPAFSAAADKSPEPDHDGLGCARGLRAAFVLEGGMLLLSYAIWHLWHVAR